MGQEDALRGRVSRLVEPLDGSVSLGLCSHLTT